MNKWEEWVADNLYRHFPAQINESPEVKQIVQVAAPELENQWNRLYRIDRNHYPKQADRDGIKTFEDWLELDVKKNDTLDTRRARIVAKLNETLPYTWIKLHRMVAAIVGWGNFTLERDGARIIFNLLIPDPDNANIIAILEMFSHVIPMNLYWEFIHRPPTKMLPIRLGMGALMSIRTEIPEHKDYNYRRYTFANLYMGARVRKRVVIGVNNG